MSSLSSTDARPQRGVLVLMSFRHSEHPYAEWLSDLSCPLLAVVREGAPSPQGFTHVGRVGAWEVQEIVECALRLNDEHGFDRVIGLGEVDTLPAAKIRETLGLDGQWYESAVVYRDKLAMRRAAADGGVDVPRFAAADTVQDVVAFVEDHGAPVMVKPRLGVGAVGIRRVDSLQEASQIEIEQRGRYLVESFVEGATYHVDALVLQAEIELAVPCAYVGEGCLSHKSDKGIGSYTLPQTSPLFARLIDATAQVTHVLPGPTDLALHAEFFVSGEEIVLCEIASRLGGGGIPSMLTHLLGEDMRRIWVRVQCGLPVDLASAEHRLRSADLVANFGLPPQNGRVRKLPDAAPADVEDLELLVSLDDDFGGSRYTRRHSGDLIATWTVTAPDEIEIMRLIDSTALAMERSVLWDLASTTIAGS